MVTRRFLLRSSIALGAACSMGRPTAAETETGFGRLILTGFRGTEPSHPEVVQIQKYLEMGLISGVLLLQRNIRSPEQLLRLVTALRNAAPDLPPVIAIDQEGGKVARLGPEAGFLPWMSAEEISLSALSEEDIESYYRSRAAELAELGINLNLGPVVDLNLNQANPAIGALERSYGSSSEVVVRFASAFVKAHRGVGVMTCLKHFPGQGSAKSDSHLGAVDISEVWQSDELTPFRDMVDLDLADAIMAGHLVLGDLADEAYRPVSLSRRGIEGLRTGLGFGGPVISDDMQMGAVSDRFSLPEAAVMSANAGVTFLIYSNYRDSDRIETASEVVASLERAEVDGRLDWMLVRSQIDLALRFRMALH